MFALTRAISSRMENGFGNIVVCTQLETHDLVGLFPRAVSMMIGVSFSARTRLQTSKPSISGSITSSRIRSGASSSAQRRPSRAVIRRECVVALTL